MATDKKAKILNRLCNEQARKASIREIINRRGIAYLVHFTRVENLKSIFEHGLCSRNLLNSLSMNFVFNDEQRLDRRLSYISTSIEFPNYKLFYKYRKDNPDVNWAVIGISSDILVNAHCLFCRENAATWYMSNQSDEELATPEAFSGMFDDSWANAPRAETHIPTWYPTNPQAEVLVPDIIPTSYIKCVVFNDNATLSKCMANIQVPAGIEVYIFDKMFNSRIDYKYWGEYKQEGNNGNTSDF